MLKKCTSSTVWRIKTLQNSSSTFHFARRWEEANSEEEGWKESHRGGVGEKSGTTRVSAPQTVDSSPHAFMNLLLACQHGDMLSPNLQESSPEITICTSGFVSTSFFCKFYSLTSLFSSPILDQSRKCVSFLRLCSHLIYVQLTDKQ